ncbi:MAG: TolC family protein [Candidatus Margulisbacteria bacterium]|nr:TolC family protein [Candidatus Margulisiibacteriota bacterium]
MLLLIVSAGAAELSLPDCIAAALRQDETVRIQELKVEELQARVWVRTASMLPRFGLSAGYTRLRTNTDDYDASLVLNQPLFAGGRYWLDRSAALLELAQAELELEKTKKELTLTTAEAYYRLLHAQEYLTAQEKSRDNLRDYFDRSAQLARQTKLPRPEELLQIEVQLGNAEISVENAALACRKARNALRKIINAPLRPEDSLLAPALPEIAADFTDDQLAQNYAYRLSLLRLQAADTAAAAARSAYWPELNLQAYSGVQWGETFPQDGTNYTQWGVALQMLLFDFFKTPKLAEQSSSVYQQNEWAVELLWRQLLTELADVLDAGRAVAKRKELTAANLDRAAESLRLYQERSMSYTANSKQLLDAEQAALQASVNQLDAALAYYLNVLELKRLLGLGALDEFK